ncbi:kinase-like protein [Histomonas meleagridis]|nr:kinase-like protein [Histomonas meleagridis]
MIHWNFRKAVQRTRRTSSANFLIETQRKDLAQARQKSKRSKMHPFFSDVDWKQLLLKAIPMEWKPDLSSTTDTSQFDKGVHRGTASCVV